MEMKVRSLISKSGNMLQEFHTPSFSIGMYIAWFYTCVIWEIFN